MHNSVRQKYELEKEKHEMIIVFRLQLYNLLFHMTGIHYEVLTTCEKFYARHKYSRSEFLQHELKSHRDSMAKL